MLPDSSLVKTLSVPIVFTKLLKLTVHGETAEAVTLICAGFQIPSLKDGAIATSFQDVDNDFTQRLLGS